MAKSPKQQPDSIEKSLGDQATDADASRSDRELSLGNQSTGGDALSSLSDLNPEISEGIDADLPLINLDDRYELEGELGKGGMGAVLLATDRQLKRKVAIKRIRGSLTQSKTALQRFVTEAQSIAALPHVNIVQAYDFGRDREGPLLVLEYVAGGSLLEKLREGKLKIEEAVGITCQLCDALGKAHGAGIIHRDIKPANILLTEDGTPKLTDFGLARQDTADHGQTQAGAVLGTIDFMAPEQRQDATSTDARSDLWSLAATLYQMVTGKSPKIIKFRKVPQALADVLEKALEDAMEDRYQTAGEFRAALQASLVATAEPAHKVAIELGTGECAQCHTKNESSRKFCSECAAPLRVSCLACEEKIPVWDKICGECGGKQAELAASHRKTLSDLIETSLTLSREHEYENSLAQLKTVTESKHPFAADLREQAAKQIELITAQRDKQHQWRDQLLELANQHQQNHNYRAVIRELEKIPLPLRTDNKIAEQLSKAQAARNELATLGQQIRDDIKNKQIDGLLAKTTRYLQLKPKHQGVQKLQEQLEQRTAHRKHLQELSDAIKRAPTAAEKLPLVEQFLKLQPEDKNAEQLAQSLRQQIEGRRKQATSNSDRGGRQAKAAVADNVTTVSQDKILTKQVAEQFLANKESVTLWLYTAITLEGAQALAKSDAYLSLRGLTSLSVEVAQALATSKGMLIFGRLTSLSVEVAQALAKTKGSFLCLDGLTNMSVEVAEALAKSKAAILSFTGLESLSEAAAAALAKHTGMVRLKDPLQAQLELTRGEQKAEHDQPTRSSNRGRRQAKGSQPTQSDAAFLFPQDLAAANLPKAHVRRLKQFVGKNTLCQWAPQGISNFPTPKAVVKFSLDGTYAFFNDSESGVPVEELVIAGESGQAAKDRVASAGQPTQADAAFLFPQDLAAANLPKAHVRHLKKFVGKNTLCQWAPQGISNFPTPKAVVKFSLDGTYAFFNDSESGVPVEELVIAGKSDQKVKDCIASFGQGKTVQCPACEARLKAKNLLKHYAKVHPEQQLSSVVIENLKVATKTKTTGDAGIHRKSWATDLRRLTTKRRSNDLPLGKSHFDLRQGEPEQPTNEPEPTEWKPETWVIYVGIIALLWVQFASGQWLYTLLLTVLLSVMGDITDRFNNRKFVDGVGGVIYFAYFCIIFLCTWVLWVAWSFVVCFYQIFSEYN